MSQLLLLLSSPAFPSSSTSFRPCLKNKSFPRQMLCLDLQNLSSAKETNPFQRYMDASIFCFKIQYCKYQRVGISHIMSFMFPNIYFSDYESNQVYCIEFRNNMRIQNRINHCQHFRMLSFQPFIYECIYMYVHIQVYTHIHICTHMYTCIYTHSNICNVWHAEISVCIGIYIEFLPCRVTRLS